MSAAIRSLFTASIAVASAGVIAVSPLAPAPAVPIPTVQIPGIELTAVPALGAIPYQILVNLLGDALALAPIVIGGVGQCGIPCIGPVSPPSPVASPFTGWGAIGFGVGLLTTPFAIIGALQAGQSITQALGAGILAFQIPADNTFALLAAPREPIGPYLGGGYQFADTRARAAGAIGSAIFGALDITEQVLTGARTIVSSGLVGITVFAQTLVEGGDVIAAIQAGLAPIRDSIQTALNNTVYAIQTLRENVYSELTGGPGAATSPIPIVSAASAATAASAASAAPAASADVARSVAAARATATAAPVAAGGNDSSGDDSPGAQAATGDSGRAAAKPSRARSAEARSTGARSTGARATG
jgi:hypothetical protein